MKINTTWSQADWNKALEKVWKLSRSFEDILNFGLEHGFITSSDIIQASDIYRDPNKDYEDDEVKEMILSRGLRDIMDIIQEEYSISDIVDELDKWEVLDYIDDDDRLKSLNGSYALDAHDEDIKDEVEKDFFDEWEKTLESRYKSQLENLRNGNSDNLHEFICNIIGVGYYDKEGIIKGLEKLKDKLNKNSYNIKYE